MKLFRGVLFVVALILPFTFISLMTSPGANAQNSSLSEERIVRAEVSEADKAAPFNLTDLHVHTFSVRSDGSVAARPSPFSSAIGASELRKPAPPNEASQADSASSIAGVPAPGYYPSDLSNPGSGPTVSSAHSNDVYVNCSNACWGAPANFLKQLGESNFIHIADQYVGATADNRYTVGHSTYITYPVFTALTDNDILSIVHAAAKIHGTGYGHIYHVFLPKGTDICFVGTTACYSPDVPSTFFFCAYHGSVTFADLGHTLFSVEPFQDVTGCSITQPSPNGSLIDSTSSTLSHELIETITDPDGDAWIAQSSLTVFGQEIGDLCINPFGTEAVSMLEGKPYEIQQEYSNRYHACANVP